MAQPDLKTVSTVEWGIVGGAFVAFIGLFFHAYGVSFKGDAAFGGSFGGHLSGWHFAGLWLPVFLLLAAAALVAVRRFRGDLIPSTLPVGTRVVVAGVAAVATLIIIIRVVSYPGSPGDGVSAGASFGSYLILAAAVVATVFAVLDFRASGEKLPARPAGTTQS